MTSRPRVLAVDICGTLYDANTTASVVVFHHLRCANTWRHQLLSRISHPNGIIRWLLIVLAKITRFDLHRAIVLLSLRNEPSTSFNASAALYAAEHLPKVAIQPTHLRLRQMRSAGWTAILVSNAINPIVEQIARQLELPYLASTLRQRDGLLTGALSKDITGRKRDALEAHLNTSLDGLDFAVITDNRSDRDLVAAAHPAVLVSLGVPRKWMRDSNAEILCH